MAYPYILTLPLPKKSDSNITVPASAGHAMRDCRAVPGCRATVMRYRIRGFRRILDVFPLFSDQSFLSCARPRQLAVAGKFRDPDFSHFYFLSGCSGFRAKALSGMIASLTCIEHGLGHRVVKKDSSFLHSHDTRDRYIALCSMSFVIFVLFAASVRNKEV